MTIYYMAKLKNTPPLKYSPATLASMVRGPQGLLSQFKIKQPFCQIALRTDDVTKT